MKKRLKVLYIIMFIFIVLFTILFILFTNLKKEKYEVKLNEIKTEQEPLLTRFPKLGRIEECYWESDVINNDRDALGPSSYWMKGYIRLEKDEAEKIKSNFEWEPVDSEWHPSIEIKEVGKITSQWFYSEDYNDYVLSYSYFGSFYYNFDEDIIFFDIQR